MLGCQRCGGQSLYEDVNSMRGGGQLRGRALRARAALLRDRRVVAGRAALPRALPACRQRSSPYEFTVDATPAYLRKPIVADRRRGAAAERGTGCGSSSSCATRRSFVRVLGRVHVRHDIGVNRFEAWADKTMENVAGVPAGGSNELWPPPDTGVCDEDTVEGIAAGLYAYQLIYWLHRFDPKQFLVTTIDAYERDPQRVVRDVAGHVGASTTLAGAVRAASDPTAVKVMGGMTADARRKLGRFYQPHNAQLLHVFQRPACTHRLLAVDQGAADQGGRGRAGEP